MSDADNQMGGTGGERGPGPHEDAAEKADEAGRPNGKEAEQDEVEEEGEESFPASDSPGNY